MGKRKQHPVQRTEIKRNANDETETKRKKKLEIYLNTKPLEQVHRLKFLGILIDCTLVFREHINYMTEKCTKLIFALSRSAKLNWGLNHATLKIIYTGGILPLLLYGAPVWMKALD